MQNGNQAVKDSLPHGITTRLATEADSSELVAMVNEAFLYELEFTNDTRTRPELIEAYFREGCFVLLMEGGRIVASIHCEVGGERGHLGMVAVRTSHHKRGLGRLLLACGEDYIRSQGCTLSEIPIIDIRASELQPFYEHHGYRQVRVEPPTEELRVKLTKPAQLIFLEKKL